MDSIAKERVFVLPPQLDISHLDIFDSSKFSEEQRQGMLLMIQASLYDLYEAIIREGIKGKEPGVIEGSLEERVTHEIDGMMKILAALQDAQGAQKLVELKTLTFTLAWKLVSDLKGTASR